MTQESSDTTTDSTVESSTSLEEEPTKEQEVTVTREIESFYVSVTSEHDDIFDKVGGVVIGKTSQLVNHTFLVSEAVEENGETYYALYNGKNKLEGYVLSTAVKKADGAQGIYMSFGKYVTIKNSTDKVYQNFDWKVRTTTDKIKNKTYLAKGYYNHFNGDRYYSIYNNNCTWLGYLNSNAVSFKRTVGDFLGTDRNRLVSRLKSHENDRFYLGTPYRSLNGNPYNRGYVMSPNGAPTGFGPGMNCTGFVAYAYQDGGANLNKITSASNQWGGIGNAYNWRNALTANTDYL